MQMQTQSKEDYIKSIFILQKENESVATSILAKHLGIGDGSVTGMMKKLSEKQLINYEPYQGVTLTPSGRRLALKMIRRHRLWEMFLVKFLGYTWDEIHNEAEALEHVMSDDLEERIDKVLGFPKVDPHGDPIPTSTGELTEITYKNLSDCDEGDVGIVVRVKDESQEVLKYMTKLGLSLNKKIVVTQKIQFDGSVIVEIDGREVALSEKLAKSIFVQAV
jgi:DtxR family transcriptional regulator, Mn-dependent transcriptional regulator